MKIKLSNKQLMIVGAGVLLVLWFLYSNTSTAGKGDLVYFYSPNCPHCKDFMPVWDSLSVPVSKKKINCDTQKCPGIEALPTIMMNGEEYTGKRTKEGVEAFVQKNM